MNTAVCSLANTLTQYPINTAICLQACPAKAASDNVYEAVRVAALASECTKVIKAYTASMVEKMGMFK